MPRCERKHEEKERRKRAERTCSCAIPERRVQIYAKYSVSFFFFFLARQLHVKNFSLDNWKRRAPLALSRYTRPGVKLFTFPFTGDLLRLTTLYRSDVFDWNLQNCFNCIIQFFFFFNCLKNHLYVAKEWKIAYLHSNTNTSFRTLYLFTNKELCINIHVTVQVTNHLFYIPGIFSR